jgi:hypothetical protein
MATSSTAYGVTAPSGLDPFPIESVLAKIVGDNNPANASNLLDLYQVQNQTSQGNYNYNLNQQHEFAKQQLQQQMADNYAKHLLEANKTPGGLNLLSQADATRGMFSGVSPDLITNLEANQRASQAATTLEHAGAGAYSATQAGRPITDEANAATGGLLGPYGTELMLRNTAMKEAGANTRHAAGGTGPSFSMQLPVNPDLPGVTTSMSVKKGQDPRAALEAARRLGVYNPASPVPLPTRGGGARSSDDGGGGDSEAPPAKPAVSITPTTPTAPRSRTNLQPAPAAPTRVQSQSQGGGQAQRFANQWVENTVRSQNPEAYADIMANAVNGNVTVVQGPNGLQIVGKRGRY